MVRRFRSLYLLVVFSFSGVLAATYTWDDTAALTSGQTLITGDQLTLAATKTITFQGDCEILVTGDATMNVGATAGAGAVIMKPANNQNAQLVFNIAANKVLTINVWNNLTFTGNDTGTKPMYVTFRGKGTAQFRLPSGAIIRFDAQTPGTSTVGTIVSVLMEQELAGTEAGQLVFEKWSYEADSVNTDLTKHTFIKWGQNSVLRYLSQHKSGLPEAGLTYGYGTIEFDPSSAGTGQLVVSMAAGATAGDFRDSAINIYGMRVTGTGPTGGEVEVLNSDIRTGVKPKQRAGLGAIFRVTDNVAYWNYSTVHADGFPANWNAYRASTANARGLVILNNNHSLPRYANNYDQSTVAASSKYYVANTHQTGFVLGNNGTVDIAHNRFLHHIAGATNIAITDGVHVATGETATGHLHHASHVKKHNPAAFIVDGYAFQSSAVVAVDATNFYEATNDITKAQITLQGYSGLFASVGASASTGVLLNDSVSTAGVLKTDGTGTYIAGVIGKGVYDGFSAPVLSAPHTLSVHQSVATDGEHAIDIEGPLKVSCVDSVSGDTAAGFINLPTVLLDHAGRELKFTASALAVNAARPLSLLSTVEYFRYNTPSMLVNDDVEWYGINYHHNDVSRDNSALPVSSALSRPAIVGGELRSLKINKALVADASSWILDYSGPAIYLYNSTIHCHESLVLAGVRFAVREKSLASGELYPQGNNTSKVIFYNRGDKYDLNLQGIGRVLQFGSRANTMANGTAIDPVVYADGYKPASSLRDAYLDVFRQARSADVTMPTTAVNTIKLRIETACEPGVDTRDKAIHVVYLANKSQINLGWSTGQYRKETAPSTYAVLVEGDKRYQPWEFDGKLLDFVRNDPTVGDPENINGNRFSPYAQGVGTLEVAGDNIYFGAGGRYDANGDLVPDGNEFAPRGVQDGGGIIYADFGGAFTVSGSNNILLDTLIARHSAVEAKAGGVVNVASDQMILQEHGRVQTYGFDTVIDPTPKVLQKNSVKTLTINVPDMPAPEGFAPIKGMPTRGGMPRAGRAWPMRATTSVTTPVPMPSSGLLVMSAGDATEQVQVYGATRANPLHLYLSGDSTGFARVREFVTGKSDPAVLGEGANAALFIDGSARIGLGGRNWNEASVNAWNQLGEDKVSLFVNGNGVVELNDDLVVVDKLPLVATEGYGMGAVEHRITFYSDVPREIRVPAGVELDLGSFGRGGALKQQIAFAGKVRLVLEPGAKIRFPEIAASGDRSKGPILYFTDEAELVMLGDIARDAGWWTDGLTGSDKSRIKILGVGQIWLNKQARMTVFDSALVGIESDKQTPHTDVTISIKRQAGLYIGDDVSAGGAFQVGNMVDGGGDGTNARGDGVAGTEVSFKLSINGPAAICQIAREGFLGFGAGIINKVNNPNGALPSEGASFAGDGTGHAYNAWRVQSLRNVKNITLEVTQGFFDHSRIFDGTSSEASVFAIGPIDYAAAPADTTVNGGKYTLKLGDPTGAFVRGGGNVVFVDAGIPHSAPLPLSIWSTSAALTSTDNSGKYRLLAPAPLIYSYATQPPVGAETVTVTDTSYQMVSRTVSNASTQGNALAEFFLNIALPNYATYPVKLLPVGSNQSKVIAGYRIGTTIKRTEIFTARKYGEPVSPRAALETGYLIGDANDKRTGEPGSYIVP